MAIINKNGIDGKICSTCHRWKPLIDFPTDPTHGLSQGSRHCRCKECHRLKAKARYGRKKVEAYKRIGLARRKRNCQN